MNQPLAAPRISRRWTERSARAATGATWSERPALPLLDRSLAWLNSYLRLAAHHQKFAADGVSESAVAFPPAATALQFTDLLRSDPGFALWCLLSASEGAAYAGGSHEMVTGELASTTQLVDWFGRHAVPTLLAEDRLPWTVSEPSWRIRCRWGRVVVQLASQYLGGSSTEAHDRLWWILAAHLAGPAGAADCSAPLTAAWYAQLPSTLRDSVLQLDGVSDAHPGGEVIALRRAMMELGGLDTWAQHTAVGWLDVQPPPWGLLEALSETLAVVRRGRQWQREVDRAVARAKAAALRELAYGASHEINNPLTNISMRAQTLLRRETDPDKRRVLEVIHRQAHRAFDMIADMMLYAKPPELERQALDWAALVRRVVDEQATWAAQQGTELTSRLPGEPIWGWGDTTQLSVALQALIRNALEACGRAGQVIVTLAVAEEHDWVLITVDDSGPGVAPGAREHLFDPFFSGREAGRGLGFGLCKAQRIAQLHQGDVELLESSPRGSRFGLSVPLDPNE